MAAVDHAARRARLAARLPDLGVDALLVTRLVNVRYLTGFTGSNGQLLLGAGDAVFLTDGRYDEQSRREVPDVERRIYPRDFPRAFAEACRSLGSARVGFEPGGLTYRSWDELRGSGVDLAPAGEVLERLRWTKDGEELALIALAQERTDDAFDRIVSKLTEGVTERQAALDLEVAMREAGAEAVAFDSIVAFGENAAEPHHHPTDRTLRRGDVVKLDFGCITAGYHSDMTRTVAFGDPAPELLVVYEIVREAQRAAIEAVRAGTSGGDADRAARAVIEGAGYGERFGHSLGHGVGLEIHEGPTLRSGGKDVLPEGAVVTVEPGIYLAGVGGVRIEDMVVVEDGGCRPLPRSTKDLVIL